MRHPSGWAGVSADDGAHHVVPLDDLVAHTDSDECICGPRSEPLKRGDGSVSWLIVHAALDGRE